MKNIVKKLVAFALITTLICAQETHSIDSDSSVFYSIHPYPEYGYSGEAAVLEATLLDASSIEASEPAHMLQEEHPYHTIDDNFAAGLYDPFLENHFSKE